MSETISTSELIICFSSAAAVGSVIGFALWHYTRRLIVKRAGSEALEIVQDVKDQLEIKALEEQERIQEVEMELWTKVEKDFLKAEEKIEDMQETADEKKKKVESEAQSAKDKLKNMEAEIAKKELEIAAKDKALRQVMEQEKNFKEQFAQKLLEKLNANRDEVKLEMISKWIAETKTRGLKFAEELEAYTKEHAETKAKKILDMALDRFARAYCAERGIGAVVFPDETARKLFCDPEGANAKAVADHCGCDVIIEEGQEMVGVAGFDPVRRELTRRTLERVLKEKRQINPEIIKRIAENQKRELLSQIKRDGDNIAKEFRIQDLHPEIRRMMGSLRYRYSFTQNQYFHCGEVGWLAGLLAAEVGADIRSARRSGLLHDIGKAMDHAMDGGHAMIGADFIHKNGESPEIVHNVRAHHFDEQPNTDAAFLVIAADAISGARPGARRSTMESYNQKVSELQDIARSFDGVTDCFVLNGGRECRVIVNGKRVDDMNALKISRQIAERIQEECSYPGSIKVVVVRETMVSESTRAM